jgi:uncharacterized protein with FMN-binding domain
VKRALAAVAATVAGLAVLLGYKSGPVRRTAVGLTPQPGGPALPGASAAPPPGPGAAPSPAPAPAGGGGGGGGGGSPPASAAPAAPTSGGTVLTGPDVPNRYGDVQVRVTVQGGKIVDVTPLQMPVDRSRSAEISQAAGPLLREEVLQVQSANIDIISGATYTSESYAQSVQAALDQARQ